MRSAGKLDGKILSTGNKSRPRNENDRYIPVVDEPRKALAAFRVIERVTALIHRSNRRFHRSF